MAITIKKVTNRRELESFIRFNYHLYKNNPYSVPDLFDDMLNTFNKKKNAAFEFCEADYFLAYRDGKLVGRVAAIINHRANQTWSKKEVRFGWIDFIDDAFCEADYFLAYRDGKLVGRVAAIINHRANQTWSKKEVRFGWIDFIDDAEVADALMKAVEDWGRERGMTHIQGPLGFTDFDAEGMLIEGFDQLSTMLDESRRRLGTRTGNDPHTRTAGIYRL